MTLFEMYGDVHAAELLPAVDRQVIFFVTVNNFTNNKFLTKWEIYSRIALARFFLSLHKNFNDSAGWQFLALVVTGVGLNKTIEFAETVLYIIAVILLCLSKRQCCRSRHTRIPRPPQSNLRN